MYELMMLYLIIGELLWFGAMSYAGHKISDAGMPVAIVYSLVGVTTWPYICYRIVKSL